MIRPMVGHPLRTLLPTRNPLGVAVLAILTFAALPAVQAQTFTVLHSFTGGSDGANPEAGLVIDSGGSFEVSNGEEAGLVVRVSFPLKARET